MDYERLHDYLHNRPGTLVDFPFDPVTLVLDDSLPDDLVFSLIDDSYAQVVKSLSKSARQKIA